MNDSQVINMFVERPSQPVQSGPTDLWDDHQIAAFLKRRTDSVRRLIVLLPSFPSPIRRPASDNPFSLWMACEVIAWAENYQPPVGVQNIGKNRGRKP